MNFSIDGILDLHEDLKHGFSKCTLRIKRKENKKQKKRKVKINKFVRLFFVAKISHAH